jgi:hypothetical protein
MSNFASLKHEQGRCGEQLCKTYSSQVNTEHKVKSHCHKLLTVVVDETVDVSLNEKCKTTHQFAVQAVEPSSSFFVAVSVTMTAESEWSAQ